MRALLVLVAATALAAAGALWLVQQRGPDYWQALEVWRDAAQSAPDDSRTARLFEQAVNAGAIVWNDATKSVELYLDGLRDQRLLNEFTRVNERGTVIAAELRRTRRLSRFVAMRTRHIACPSPCDRVTDWSLDSAEHAHADAALAAAAAAARLREADVPSPHPRLHFAFSRDEREGFGRWRNWHMVGTMRVSADLSAVDTIDIVGQVVTIPPGWGVTQSWCRDDRRRLSSCQTGEVPHARRISRIAPPPSDDAGEPRTILEIGPLSVLPERPAEGRHILSDRLTLTCVKGGACKPGWRSLSASRRFSRTITDNEDGGPGGRAANPSTTARLAALGPWVRIGAAGQIEPSDLTVATGADAVVGGAIPRAQSAIAASVDLPKARRVTLSLDPAIQTIAHSVLRELTEPGADGPLSTLSFPRPKDGHRASIVVMDLRSRANAMGAIRAAVGVPGLPDGLSPWGLSARAYDARGPSLGPAAWTGRSTHHVPGSSWKVLTAMALIDAITSGALPQATVRELRQVLTGLDKREADRLLGKGALTSTAGLCIPTRLAVGQPGGGVRGAVYRDGEPHCPTGYFGKPVRDSGKGGPLSGKTTARFGLVQALERSSNIWFVAALLHAEANLPQAQRGQILAGFASRLGLVERQSVDGGLGLALDRRDPADLEYLREPANVSALAVAAFGQRVQAGPLVLAQIAAAAATGRDVRPTLFAPAAASRPLYRSNEARSLLATVKRGMRDVVSAPGGTARRSFARRAPDLVSRAAGKTGTADRGTPGHAGRLERNSTFAGWLDDETGRPAFAIGCSVSLRGREIDGVVRVTQVCAHAVAELMRRIDAEILDARQ